MRIVEQTPDRLVLEIRPVALMVLCVGLFLLFFVLGFGMRLILPAIAGKSAAGTFTFRSSRTAQAVASAKASSCSGVAPASCRW